MSILEKLIFIILAGVIIFLWTKYAIPYAIQRLIKINEKNTWLKNQKNIIEKVSKGFYWFFFVLLIFTMIISK
tara:strand:+ start:69 stop:287 length:219 start_codon:yes stop_codon:yes gene_type:complete